MRDFFYIHASVGVELCTSFLKRVTVVGHSTKTYIDLANRRGCYVAIIFKTSCVFLKPAGSEPCKNKWTGINGLSR